jgi:hypothetical protein
VTIFYSRQYPTIRCRWSIGLQFRSVNFGSRQVFQKRKRQGMMRHIALLFVSSAVGLVTDQLPLLQELTRETWCQRILQKAYKLDDIKIGALGDAFCAELSVKRCVTWSGLKPESAPARADCGKEGRVSEDTGDALAQTHGCCAAYWDVLTSDKVAFPSGFRFLSHIRGFANAKKWIQDLQTAADTSWLGQDPSVALRKSLKDAALRPLAGLRQAALVTDEWCGPKGVPPSDSPPHAPPHAPSSPRPMHRLRRLSKLYKRLQMALVVDERLVVVNDVVEKCGQHALSLDTADTKVAGYTDDKGKRIFKANADGSIELTSDYDITVKGGRAGGVVACFNAAFKLHLVPAALRLASGTS